MSLELLLAQLESVPDTVQGELWGGKGVSQVPGTFWHVHGTLASRSRGGGLVFRLRLSPGWPTNITLETASCRRWLTGTCYQGSRVTVHTATPDGPRPKALPGVGTPRCGDGLKMENNEGGAPLPVPRPVYISDAPEACSCRWMEGRR